MSFRVILPPLPPQARSIYQQIARAAEEAALFLVPLPLPGAGLAVRGAEEAAAAGRAAAAATRATGIATAIGRGLRTIISEIWRTPGVRLGVGAAAAGAGIATAIGSITTAITGQPNPVFQQPPFAPLVPILTGLAQQAAPPQAQAPPATQSPFLPLSAGLGIGLAAGVLIMLLARPAGRK